MFILTIDYSNNFTTNKVLTIEHMAMFVVKSIHIQINGQVMDLSILLAHNQVKIQIDFAHQNHFYYNIFKFMLVQNVCRSFS